MPDQLTAPDKQSSETTEFTLFPHLPADIRQEVWTIAASTTGSASPDSLTPGISFYTEKHISRDSKDTTPPQLLVHEPYNQALLQTNTEAHDVALMSTGPVRDYNPEIDILYMTTSLCFHDFAGHASNRVWASKARHIALPLCEAGVFGEIPAYTRDPGRLPSLKTISIVFPGSSGTFSCFQEMQQPEELLQGMALRRLTREELEEITVKSQFNYSTWAGDLPVDYSSTGPEYLNAYEEALRRQAQSSGSGQEGPVGEKTMVRWEARCFEPWPSRERFCDRVGNTRGA